MRERDGFEFWDNAELWLILVGRTSGGKSAMGNTILSQRVFESILAAKTTPRCQRGQGSWQGMKILVVDTPDMFDTDDYMEMVRQDILACIQLSWPRPHALILVTQVGLFTTKDAATAKCIWEIFGAESTSHTIVLFTCVEDLGGSPLDEHLIWQCGNCFCRCVINHILQWSTYTACRNRAPPPPRGCHKSHSPTEHFPGL
uniref:AIG1-type G domain-containing protein n=1 Tax=Naja naja TaxID=35670 RepID=A0A8C6XHS8_NAJNA